ncbi:MAG: DNA methyltransferase [Bacteroidota bacterium]
MKSDGCSNLMEPYGLIWAILILEAETIVGKRQGSLLKNIRNVKVGEIAPQNPNTHPGNKLKKKCQVLIPHRFAIGCIERGWILRNDIIWAKPNGAPESVQDRFSKKHEFIFLFAKQANYYFDLDSIREEHKETSLSRNKYPMTAYRG